MRMGILKFKDSLACLRSLSILLRILVVLEAGPTHAFVTEENGFVILKTRDSGSFVGVREDEDEGIRSESSRSKAFYAFRGIPYAKPPVGNLRWKEPELADVTAGLKDATKFKPCCPQWDAGKGLPIGNPDCLYLNVFTPRLHFSITRAQEELSPYDEDPRNSIRLLPTLVYIHDGNFISGSGDIPHYERFMEENTILVSFNFRLGVFGFLSSNDSSLPGNYGILDQILALKWIRKNIHRFGGDPNRVTIFGDVSSVMLSPLATEGLLYQGIILMESTTSVFTPGIIIPEPKKFYSKLLSLSHCPEPSSSEDTLDCFRIMPSEDLIRAQEEIIKAGVVGAPIIGPVVDAFPDRYNFSAVFPVHPDEEIRSQTFLTRKIPILFGLNLAGGFRPFRNFYNKFLINATSSEEELKKSLQLTLRPILPISKETMENIWEFYFGNLTIARIEGNSSLLRPMLNLFSDLTVNSANWKLMQVLSEKKEVVLYNYVLDQNTEKVGSYLTGEGAFLGGGVNESFPWEEKFYLFSLARNETDEKYNPNDEFMAKFLVKIWSSFAAYRTTKNALTKKRSWGKWVQFRVNDQNSTNYYHLTPTHSQMKVDFRRKQMEFWNGVFNSKLNLEQATKEMLEEEKRKQEEAKEAEAEKGVVSGEDPGSENREPFSNYKNVGSGGSTFTAGSLLVLLLPFSFSL